MDLCPVATLDDYIQRTDLERWTLRSHSRSRMRNMISATEHSAVVAKYLDGERSHKRVALARGKRHLGCTVAHSESFPKRIKLTSGD